MAKEPRVGMEYGSFLKFSNDYQRMSASRQETAQERTKATNPSEKIDVFSTTYLDKDGIPMGQSTVEINGNEKTVTFYADSFTYTGTGKASSEDIKYTKIIGKTTMAVDGANGCPKDGIVQQGEIMPRDK